MSTTKHLHLLLLSLALSSEVSAVTRLTIYGVENTDTDNVFYLKTDKADNYVKLDCLSLANFLYSRSESDDELNFDFFIEANECEQIYTEVKTYSNPGNPMCLDIDFEQPGFILYRKCEKGKK
ncbi:MAG: hypothetical protein ACOYL6_11375 [Bacteriovoracaceae bacterium]